MQINFGRGNLIYIPNGTGVVELLKSVEEVVEGVEEALEGVENVVVV